MAKVDFELNLPGLNELMKSGEMQGILKQAGEATAGVAGDGFETETRVLTFAAIQNVYPVTRDAYFKNLEENTLGVALGASGLRMK